MFDEFYKTLSSFPEEKFVVEDKLSQSVLNSLRDPICLNIPNIFCKESPAECKKCSQVICAKCVEMTLKGDSKCPNCKDFLQVRKMNRYLKQILATIKMRCHLHANGCNVALPLEELIKHENQCEFETIPCPKKCGKRVIRKYSLDHVENECPLEEMQCLYKGCNVKMPRGQIEKHINECPLQDQRDTFIKENVPDKGGKVFDDAEIVLGYESEHDEQNDFEKIEENHEKGWKISLLNLKDNVANGSDSPLTKCKNAGCRTMTMYAELIRNHEKVCCYKIEPCKYQKNGCTFSGNQYGLVSHQAKCPFATAGNHNGSKGDKDNPVTEESNVETRLKISKKQDR